MEFGLVTDGILGVFFASKKKKDVVSNTLVSNTVGVEYQSGDACSAILLMRQALSQRSIEYFLPPSR